MSLQTQIDRIESCVSDQTQLIEQIKTVLEKKASGKKDEVTVEISSTIAMTFFSSMNTANIAENTLKTFTVEKGSLIFLRPKDIMDISAFQVVTSERKLSNSKYGVVILIDGDPESTIRRVEVSLNDPIIT